MEGDGIDNDCDGKIDEERINGKDDDDDGLVDEDFIKVRWKSWLILWYSMIFLKFY